MNIDTSEEDYKKGYSEIYKINCSCGKEHKVIVTIKRNSKYVYSVYVNSKENI